MPDILDKLVPNLQTMLVQLVATFIIYLIYRKFLHEPVVNYLDSRADKMREAEIYAEKVEEEAKARQEELKAEHKKALENVERLREQTLKEIAEEREHLLEKARSESDRIIERANEQIEASRDSMMEEVEEHAIDLAANITKRALQGMNVSEEDSLKSLEAEMNRVMHHAK